MDFFISDERGFILPLVLIILGALVAAGAGVGIAVYVHRGQAPIAPTVAPAKEVAINFSVPKAQYMVGEPFVNASFSVLAHQSNPFQVVVLTTSPRATGTAVLAVSREDIGGNETKNDHGLFAQGSNPSAFSDAGTYRYIVSVYDCADIEKQLGAGCGGNVLDLDARIISSTISPFASSSLVIDVKAKAGTPAPTAKHVSPVPPVAAGTVASCKDDACANGYLATFLKNFKSCTPVQGTTMIGFEGIIGAYRNYKILGITNNLCEVSFSFGLLSSFDLSTLPPAAQENDKVLASGKEMLCKYTLQDRTLSDAHSINVVASFTGNNTCSGPLYDDILKVRATAK